MVKYLLNLPTIDVDAGKSHRNGTALHYAVRHGHQACIVQLVDAGADIAATEAKGMTPLHIAAETGQLKIIV